MSRPLTGTGRTFTDDDVKTRHISSLWGSGYGGMPRKTFGIYLSRIFVSDMLNLTKRPCILQANAKNLRFTDRLGRVGLPP